ESPTFLSQFNAAYYQAVGTDPSVKNSVPKLKQIAATVLPTVEGVPFTTTGGTPGWYERQYILDTAVTPGVKLYAVSEDALRASPPPDDPAIAVTLIYYRTTFDTSGNSDEQSLNGTCYPIYWDYTFTNRLFLAAQYERV